MGKRGPQASENSRTSYVTVRLSPLFRQLLEFAAKKRCGKLGDEIELRLRGSFSPEEIVALMRDQQAKE